MRGRFSWALLALSACSAPIAVEPAPAKPNVVLILADDLGWGELGCYGQQKIRTPNVDRLAAEGIRLTQFYSGAPVCAPARNVLLTGRHLGHVTIRGNRPARDENGKRVEGQHPIPESALTLAEVFREAGYVTGAMGKWGLGPVGSTGDPNAQGFDEFFGYNCQRVAHSYYPPHLWHDSDKVVINEEPVAPHQKKPEGEVIFEEWQAETYAPARILDQAVEFLHAHADEPFFLYLPFVEPHVAMQPPTELVESYPEAWDDRPYRGQCGYLPHPRPRAGYAAMISDLDRHVGTILDTLAALGLTDDTLVVFTSDNGTTHPSGGDPVLGVGGVDAAFFDSTRGLRGFKGSVYEGGLRVPFIARWPGRIEEGAIADFPGYFADAFATLCEAAGTETPNGLDGVSLWPTLTGNASQVERTPMVWVFPEYGGQVAVRFGRWKLLQRNILRKQRTPWELYDVEADPSETNDLASERPDLVREGARVLREQADENELFPVPIPEP